MKHNILYTLSIALVVVLLFSVVSLISASNFDPTNDRFLPMIFGKGQSPNPSGALYVFSSVGTTTGNGGGRSGMNAICSATDIESHFCTVYEIENALKSSGAYFSTPFSDSWADNLSQTSLGYWYTGKCNGWTIDTIEGTGYRITSSGVSLDWTTTCDAVLNVACCKWIP